MDVRRLSQRCGVDKARGGLHWPGSPCSRRPALQRSCTSQRHVGQQNEASDSDRWLDEPSTSSSAWRSQEHSHSTRHQHQLRPLARGAAAAAVAMLAGVALGPAQPISLLPASHAQTATTQITHNSTRSGSSSWQLSSFTTDASSTSTSVTPVADTASEVEDKLLEAVRQVEARVGSAVGAATLPWAPGAAPLSAEEAARVRASAETLVREVWEVVDTNYLDARATGWDRARWGRLKEEALARTYTDTASIHRAIREMMAWGLSDPYCRFISPDELSAMKKYDVTGVGLNLGTGVEYTRKTGKPLPQGRTADDTGVWVVGLSKGSPADKVGVRQGDELLEVDGTDLTNLSPFQAASLISGSSPSVDGAPPHAYVDIKVRRTDGMTGSLRVERPMRTLASPVSASLIKLGGEPAGSLRLSSFNARAQRDLSAAISSLEAQGAKSLVLDLRDNRGGLVSEGLEVARLFLSDDAPIVFTETRATPGDAARAGNADPLTRLPLTVLVNEHTASASEIVAGALHDNCRAVLVGSKTYGKGLIQSVYELSDGSGIVLTVGKYLTPSRTDIDRAGIQPDFSAQPSLRLASETLNACRLSSRAVVTNAPPVRAGTAAGSTR